MTKEINSPSNKADWQRIAKKHKVKFTDANVVRYLVEKVAEKIGVDDKIVNIAKLKKAVIDKLIKISLEENVPDVEVAKSNKTVTEGEKEVKKTPSKKKTAKKTTKKATVSKKKTTKGVVASPKKEEKASKPTKPQLTGIPLEVARKRHYVGQAELIGCNFGANQTAQDIKLLIEHFCKSQNKTYIPFEGDSTPAQMKEEAVKTETSSTLSKLDQLRAECEKYGVGFAPAHTEQDLEQLINAVKGAGAIPVAQPTKSTELAQDSFELNTDNLEDIKKNAPIESHAANPAIVAANPAQQVGATPAFLQAAPPAPVQDPSVVDAGQLEVYKNTFMQTINGHFRLLSGQEVADLFTQAVYPFTQVITPHPSNQNQIEIILTSGENSVRLPSDNKDEWITING